MAQPLTFRILCKHTTLAATLSVVSAASQAYLIDQATMQPGCQEGAVCMTEQAFDDYLGSGLRAVEYAVTNQSPSPVWAFGVTNGDPAITPEAIANFQTFVSGFWNGLIVEKEAWNSGTYSDFQRHADDTGHNYTSTWYSGASNPTREAQGKTALGSWETMFGATSDSYAAFFWQSYLPSGGIAYGTTLEGHLWWGVGPYSNFATYGADGTITAQGEVVNLSAPVPEPGSYALLLAGLGVLGWATRRARR